jgi:hypothetical protein
MPCPQQLRLIRKNRITLIAEQTKKDFKPRIIKINAEKDEFDQLVLDRSVV